MSKTKIEWEPSNQGALFIISNEDFDAQTQLDRDELNELRRDFEEAYYLTRGYEKVLCSAHEVQIGDNISVGGQTLLVSDVLKEKGDVIVLQSPRFELRVEWGDETLTVWRVIQ